MADLIFHAQFIASKVGATGLTVTVDIDRYTISDGSRTALVTGGSATEGRRGLYHYRLASADLSLYQYVATFITADTDVEQQEMSALGLVVPDALVSAWVITSNSDSTAAGAITRMRGNTWSISLTVGAITGYTSLWFTVKHSQDDADSDAILQIKLNSTGSDDDLLYVNGATASDSTLGTITVSDASTGAIIIAVDETVTDDMPAGAFYYDIQVLNSGTVTTPDSGTFTITADVTRSVT